MLDFHALAQGYDDLKELAYSPQGEGQGWFDQNDLTRGRVILGIQYSSTEPSVEVLRFLLEQEILRAENDPFQGVGESLEVLAWLLAMRKHPEDALRFLRTKKANFDAHCGFDIQHVYVSGIPALQRFLETVPMEEPLRAELNEHIEDPLYDGDEIEEWLAWRSDYFGRDWERETDLFRSDKLRDLNFAEESEEYLRRWEAAGREERDELQALRRRKLELGRYEEAVILTRKVLAFELSEGQRITENSILTKCLELDGNHLDALRALGSYIKELQTMKEWYRYGYGREAVERCYSLATQDFDGAGTALAWGVELDKQLTNRPPVLLELAAKAEQLHYGTSP